MHKFPPADFNLIDHGYQPEIPVLETAYKAHRRSIGAPIRARDHAQRACYAALHPCATGFAATRMSCASEKDQLLGPRSSCK
jgi:hypothetical protein